MKSIVKEIYIKGANNDIEGCVATSEANVINILKWLSPSKIPIIIQAPMSEVLKM